MLGSRRPVSEESTWMATDSQSNLHYITDIKYYFCILPGLHTGIVFVNTHFSLWLSLLFSFKMNFKTPDRTEMCQATHSFY